MITVSEGEMLALVESFVDEFDDPLELANDEAGPYVEVFDHNRQIVLQTSAVPDINGAPGDWVANISIPVMGLDTKQKFTARFTFRDAYDNSHTAKQSFYVDPVQEHRNTDIVFLLGRNRRIEFAIPTEFVAPVIAVPSTGGVPAKPGRAGDDLRVMLYNENNALYGEDGIDLTDASSGASVVVTPNKTSISIPGVVGSIHQLKPLTLIVEHTKVGQSNPRMYTFKLWAVTPSVLGAATQLEDFINKARSSNVIPELDYTMADLVQYLHRGLSMFNGFRPQLTQFTGMNMQGMIQSGWLDCSSYYALVSQLGAEGSMAFDFSGQTVQLNVDRTPAIESVLGRVESALNDRIPQLKQLLTKAGINSGDGSDGGRPINGSTNLGVLGVINAPTTRFFGVGVRRNNIGIRRN
jgi:hypothetical protein